MFYDIAGNELKVGAIVTVPSWDNRKMLLGVIKNLNTNYDEDNGRTHLVEVIVDNEKVTGLWRSNSITVLPEATAVMVRLRDFEALDYDSLSH